MREILFRGKRIDGEWVYGHYQEALRNMQKRSFIINLTGTCEVVPETVGQKTEFSDKNGIQIFEGDRFKSLRHQGTVLFIGSGFKLVKDSKKAGPKIWSLSHHTCRSIEIIGNIHEQPKN